MGKKNQGSSQISNADKRVKIRPSIPLEDRLWSQVDRSVDGCWNWKRGITAGGYGQINVGGRIHHTHRLAYSFANGEIPHGSVVRHSCDNRRCCRPSHLLIGTKADNMMDMHKRKRFVNARLTHDDVAFIRANYKPRDKYFGAVALSKKFGVVASSIVRIVHMFPDKKGSLPWNNAYSEARRDG